MTLKWGLKNAYHCAPFKLWALNITALGKTTSHYLLETQISLNTAAGR